MKHELPCDIVLDLLPIYAENLTSDVSAEAVNEHLKSCSKCNSQYLEIKKDYDTQKNTADSPESKALQDKTLFKKINSRLSRKIRATIVVCAAAILLLILCWEFLYNDAFKKVSPEDVLVSVNVYDIDELLDNGTATVDSSDNDYSASFSTVYADKTDSHPDYEPVTIFSSEEDTTSSDEYVGILIPKLAHINLSKSAYENLDYISHISFSSKYNLRTIYYEVQNEYGKNVMIISGYRTTFLNNKSSLLTCSTSCLEFQRIDEVVYRDDRGSNITLWSRE